MPGLSAAHVDADLAITKNVTIRVTLDEISHDFLAVHKARLERNNFRTIFKRRGVRNNNSRRRFVCPKTNAKKRQAALKLSLFCGPVKAGDEPAPLAAKRDICPLESLIDERFAESWKLSSS